MKKIWSQKSRDTAPLNETSVWKRIKSLNCDNDVQEMIDMNQGLLVSLGVSHPALNKVVEVAASHNIHAKVHL